MSSEVAENPTDAGSDAGADNGEDSARVFVGNLSWRTSWQNLKDHMRGAGEVRFADVFYERSTNGRRPRSKGCGVVEFESVDEAKKAIDELNESELDGRTIFVQADNRPNDRDQGRRKPRQRSDKPRRAPKSKSPGGNPKRVYVGNLAWQTSWQTLKDHMKTVGEVAFVDLFETYNGRSRGCALVEYESEDIAKKAIEELNDTELDGRKIFCREDREKKENPKKEKGGRQTKGGAGDDGDNESEASSPSNDDPDSKLYVGNLTYSTTDTDIEDLFSKFGLVKSEIKKTKNGRSKGFGIVSFDNKENATKAIEKFNDTEFKGRFITVRLDRKGGGKTARKENRVAL